MFSVKNQNTVTFRPLSSPLSSFYFYDERKPGIFRLSGEICRNRVLKTGTVLGKPGRLEALQFLTHLLSHSSLFIMMAMNAKSGHFGFIEKFAGTDD